MATLALAKFPTPTTPLLWKQLPKRRSHRDLSEFSRVGLTNNHGARFRGGPNSIAIQRFKGYGRSPPGRLIKCLAGEREENEPLLLRVAVSGATELLRVVSGGKNDKLSTPPADQEAQERAENEAENSDARIVSSADLVEAIRSDFAKSYFLTGEFSDSLYSKNCFYKDPTIRFSGRDLYKRNLKLLVPFYEDPSLILDSIREDSVKDESSTVILANWRLRVYLKLPWKPFIAVDGLTTYCWDKNVNGIVSHVESWNITGLQAMAQLFTPSDRAFWRSRRGIAKQG